MLEEEVVVLVVKLVLVFLWPVFLLARREDLPAGAFVIVPAVFWGFIIIWYFLCLTFYLFV